jgi:hypothetical protein
VCWKARHSLVWEYCLFLNAATLLVASSLRHEEKKYKNGRKRTQRGKMAELKLAGCER